MENQIKFYGDPEKCLESYEPTHHIAPDFKYGKNVIIGKYVIIEEGCVVGDDVVIKDFVRLGRNTKIGHRCMIDSYVKSSGDNSIGNDCTLRYNSTIARNLHMMDGVFIAPNVMTVHNKDKTTLIEKNVRIYTGAVIDGGIWIVHDCAIGAMSFVKYDCVESGLYVGSPAKMIKRF